MVHLIGLDVGRSIQHYGTDGQPRHIATGGLRILQGVHQSSVLRTRNGYLWQSEMSGACKLDFLQV
jgi:hypothetical protein